MKTLYIMGFGCADKNEMTLGTLELLKSCDKVFVRTTLHPAAAVLLELNIAYTSFDAMYEQAESFEELYEAICDEVLNASAQRVCYIVPGSPVFAEKAVMLMLKKAQCEVKLLPAVSFIDGVFSALRTDGAAGFKLIDAMDIKNSFPDTSVINIICQVYSREIASDVKLELMKTYEDETPIILVSEAGGEKERLERVMLYEIDMLDDIDHLSSLVIMPISQNKPTGDFSGFVRIIDALRSEGGCEWDRAQTHESLKQYFVEETYEVLEAIDSKDDENLCEELGDVLLQVLLHARIAAEENSFDIRDVVRGVSGKMIRRHPHVFEKSEADVDLIKQWEEIKEKEHSHHSASEKLAGIPKSFPALLYAYKLQQKAANANFDFDSPEEVFDKLKEETEEFRQALARDNEREIFDEGGDILFSAVNLLRLCGIEPEEALKASSDKFFRRFSLMEKLIKDCGEDFYRLDGKAKEKYWQKAKKS